MMKVKLGELNGIGLRRKEVKYLTFKKNYVDMCFNMDNNGYQIIIIF